MSHNQQMLTVVVSGTPVQVEVNVQAPLRTLIPEALRESEQAGRSPEEWELRDAQGNLFDLDRKIGSYGFATDTRLYLNLKAGIGG